MNVRALILILLALVSINACSGGEPNASAALFLRIQQAAGEQLELDFYDGEPRDVCSRAEEPIDARLLSPTFDAPIRLVAPGDQDYWIAARICSRRRVTHYGTSGKIPAVVAGGKIAQVEIQLEAGSSCKALCADTLRIEIATTELPNGLVGAPYEATLAAINASGEGLNWFVSAGQIPPGLTLSESGAISGTPNTAGDFNVTIAVLDGNGDSDTQTFDLQILAAPIDLAILTASIPDGVVSAEFRAPLIGIGGSGVDYQWSITGMLPPGLLLDSSGTPNTLLHGTPESRGSYSFSIKLRDSLNNAVTSSYAMTVAEPLRIDPRAPLTAEVGVEYRSILTASGGAGRDHNWLIDGELPSGLKLVQTGSTASIEGTPDQPGLSTISVSVMDGARLSASIRLSINVLGHQRYVAWVGDTARNTERSVFVADLTALLGDQILVSTATARSGNAELARFSPDNSALAFEGDLRVDTVNELFVVDLSGSSISDRPSVARVNDDLVNLGDVTEFAWSPESDWILYCADQRVDDKFELFLRGADAMVSVVSDVTNPNGDVNAFAWSPDGTKVVYSADQRVEGVFELWWVSILPNLSSPLQLHDSQSNALDVILWTPDSTRVVYVTNDPIAGSELWATDVQNSMASGAPLKLSGMTATGSIAPDVQISPDGSFVAYRSNQNPNSAFELFLVDLRTTDPFPQEISGSNSNVRRFAWSPDGSRLLYLAVGIDFVPTLYLVEVRSTLSNPMAIAEFSPHGFSPLFQWSPDGRFVGYRSDTEILGRYQIYVVDVGGSVPGPALKVSPPLVAGRDFEAFEFSPDGARVALRGDPSIAGSDQLFVSELTGPGGPAIATAVTRAGAGLNMVSFAWLRDSDRLLVRGDLEVNNVFNIYLTSVSSRAPIRLHPTPPTDGNADILVPPF